MNGQEKRETNKKEIDVDTGMPDTEESRENEEKKLLNHLKNLEKKMDEEHRQEMKEAGKITFMGIVDTICMDINPFSLWDGLFKKKSSYKKRYYLNYRPRFENGKYLH